MPIVTVWNTPIQPIDRRRFTGRLAEDIVKAFLSLREFSETDPRDIAVSFPEGTTFPTNFTLISVDILFDTPERTREMRRRLAEALHCAATSFYEEFGEGARRVIEVVIKRFDPETDVYFFGKDC